MKTLEKDVKYVQGNAKGTIYNGLIYIVLMSLLLTLNIFHTFF